MEQKITILDTMILSCAGENPEEAFETILNKKCMFKKSENLPFGDDYLYVADIQTDGVSAFINSEILKKANSIGAKIFVCIDDDQKNGVIAKIKTQNIDGSISFFTSDIEAIDEASKAIISNQTKAVLVAGIGNIDFGQIKTLLSYGKYSHTVCKPYDVESDGINSSNSVCAILLSTESGEYALEGVSIASNPIETIQKTIRQTGVNINSIGFIEGGSNASVQADRVEVEAIAEIFGQSITLTSSKGALGYSEKNSFLEGICMATVGLTDGIIHSDTGLEHGFSIEATLAYGSKFKNFSSVIVNGYDSINDKWCSAIVKKA